MELPKEFREYEGDLKCEVCRKVIEEDEMVDVIYVDMIGEADMDHVITQYHDEKTEEYVLCKNCSKKIKIVLGD